MKDQRRPVEAGCVGAPHDHEADGRFRRWLRRWCLMNVTLSGLFALLWLVLRSGRKPSRFAYPCQQAAFGTATAAFAVPLAATLLSARRRIASAVATPPGRLLSVCGLVCTLALGAWALSPRPSGYQPGPPPPPRQGYRAQVFQIDGAGGPNGQHFGGVDDIILWMGLHGLKFYGSAGVENFETGPDGLIAADDTVVIKINYQWDERGGTNVDVLNGLIRRIVDHPDGFTGELVVCENAQFNSTSNFDRSQNNAENTLLSPHDVVLQYQMQGHTVSHYDWTLRRYTLVTEYSAGNMTDGYIRFAYDSRIQGRVSYPKFQTSYGTYISLKYGIWNPANSTYDRDHLKFINLPVLKSHHATYGATACVKHYMGVVTRELSTDSHSAIRHGLLGALLGEIQLADLNLLDCIWINANPYGGPWTTYGEATRVDKLVASLDPVAADIWAVKNILIPTFFANGFAPPWPYPSADPDDPSSEFRFYLDNSMSQILAAGYDATNDFARIDAYAWDGNVGTVGDVNGDGAINGGDVASFVGVILGNNTDPLAMLRSDMDGDRDVDVSDMPLFVAALVSP